MPASEMFSFRSPAFTKLGLHRDDLSGDALIDLMLKEPRLIRRPVVRIGEAVHFGADRKRLETLLGHSRE
jgi:arsenate reductase-like glutaredoxin family protein